MHHLIDLIPKEEILFKEAVSEFYDSMSPYLEESVFKQMIYPDSIHIFKVPWYDRNDQLQINTAYRIQHSQALGPYKGGIRFHQSVNLDSLKFLAFEQMLKNALTGLALGAAKGGADFDPHDKTDLEIYRFIESFMIESYRLFGPNMDVPAGDIGVGQKEVAMMQYQYQRLNKSYISTFTGKPVEYQGALGREEATGYGLVYIVEELLKDLETNIKHKRIIISGCGNVAIHAAEKAQEKGAIIVGMSDSQGHVYHEDGLDVKEIKQKRLNKKMRLSEIYPNDYREGTVFQYPSDLVFPCATQGELDKEHLHLLIQQGCMLIAEGANRPLTLEAINSLKDLDIYYIPGKMANAGGVAVSGIEMMQNAQREQYTFEDVDDRLANIMKSIYYNVKQISFDLDNPFHFVKASNYFAYQRISKALKLQRPLNIVTIK